MKHGEFKNVELSEEEFSKLQARLGSTVTLRLIEDLSTYMEAKRTKYKSHYAVIVMWARRNDPNNGVASRSEFRLTEEELRAQREKEHQRMFKAKA